MYRGLQCAVRRWHRAWSLSAELGQGVGKCLPRRWRDVLLLFSAASSLAQRPAKPRSWILAGQSRMSHLAVCFHHFHSACILGMSAPLPCLGGKEEQWELSTHPPMCCVLFFQLQSLSSSPGPTVLPSPSPWAGRCCPFTGAHRSPWGLPVEDGHWQSHAEGLCWCLAWRWGGEGSRRSVEIEDHQQRQQDVSCILPASWGAVLWSWACCPLAWGDCLGWALISISWLTLGSPLAEGCFARPGKHPLTAAWLCTALQL